MIANKIHLLKKAASLQHGLEFPSNTEFHIVMDVVYMQGFPLPPNLQSLIYNWIVSNPSLFKEIFR